MKLTKELRDEYQKLWDSMMPMYHTSYIKIIANKIVSLKEEYLKVEKETKVPWYVVGCIHYMEAGLNFSKQIHNGESWSKKTTLVPVGLGPWNSWEDAALDAMETLHLKMFKTLGFFSWGIPEICFCFESHNGWGYRKYHSHVKSPYLWSFSNHYDSGKYIADGKWSDTAVSKQMGAMTIIREIFEHEDFFKGDTPIQEPVKDVVPNSIPAQKPKPIVKKNLWQKICAWFKSL
jgi:lysozyme family protein